MALTTDWIVHPISPKKAKTFLEWQSLVIQFLKIRGVQWWTTWSIMTAILIQTLKFYVLPKEEARFYLHLYIHPRKQPCNGNNTRNRLNGKLGYNLSQILLFSCMVWTMLKKNPGRNWIPKMKNGSKNINNISSQSIKLNQNQKFI
jgi:hypothetical protein